MRKIQHKTKSPLKHQRTPSLFQKKKKLQEKKGGEDEKQMKKK